MIPGELPLALLTTQAVVTPPAVAPMASTIPEGFLPAPPTTEPVVPPPAVVPPAPPVCAKLLKLDLIKDAKAFFDSFEQTQFYLCMPDFSMGHANEALTTNSGN
jgi:hypothetical protein